MSSDERQPVDYKIHILIGVRPNGIMNVIAEWPSVPRQAEVQEQIDVGVRGGAPRLGRADAAARG